MSNEPTKRIVCAAMMAEGTSIVICSPRHWDTVAHAMVKTFSAEVRASLRTKWVQGFVNTHGEFLTRNEAWVVAWQNRQLVRLVGNQGVHHESYINRDPAPEGVELFSENLY